MIHVQLSRNAPLIKEILTSPEIYAVISDDAAPDPKKFKPDVHKSIHIIVYDDKTPIGLVIYTKKTSIEYLCHYQILPGHRGEDAFIGAQKCIEWLWKNTPALKLTAEVPTKYKNVLDFGFKLGFVKEGINKFSYRSDNKIYDKIHLGLIKGEEQWVQ